MKYKKRFSAFWLAALLACTFCMAAYAHEVPDANKKGEIIVEMCYDGKAVEGGAVTAYRIGQVRQNNGDYSFVKTPAMEGFSGSYDDIGAPELAERAAAFVKEQGIKDCVEAKNTEGKAVLTDLELGLYLIVQTEAAEGCEPLKPFLVSIPMNVDGQYIYEVNAEGKIQLHQELKPAEPSKPADPNLPQTGQMNWPIPLLTMLGLGLFSAGWVLRRERKKGV